MTHFKIKFNKPPQEEYVKLFLIIFQTWCWRILLITYTMETMARNNMYKRNQCNNEHSDKTIFYKIIF